VAASGDGVVVIVVVPPDDHGDVERGVVPVPPGDDGKQPAIVKTDASPCERAHIGRIIGPRGVTVNNLQRQSFCRIQVDQANCAVYVTRMRTGIELARMMLGEIEEWGANHPYDGGNRFIDDRRQLMRGPSPRDGGDDGDD